MPPSICRMVGAACIGLLVSACSSLPDVNYLRAPLPEGTTPTVVNANGTLGRKAAHALLASRLKGSQEDASTLAAVEELATRRPLIAGNKVTLLYDGPQTMASMMEAIRGAKDHINLETYIFDQDAVGMAFADLLIERQRAGVQVNVMYDSVGTIGTPQSFFSRMQEAGIALVAFNPVNPFKLVGPWVPNNRDHRKILVVDGRVAFTGGVNISSTYANSSLFRSKARRDGKVGWRDTHIRIEGPAVAALQWVFLDAWAAQTTSDISSRTYFPPLQAEGNKLVRVLASAPDGDQEIYQAYLLAIGSAQTSVHITTAYFVPDVRILGALGAAARRGVDVKIILPGVLESGLVFYAGNSFYSQMLESGIRVFQLQVAVLHAKTAVIDGIWSTVGSTNIDTRSFLHNHEINVVVMDNEFGLAMERAFEEDLRLSTEVTPGQWAQRPLTDRLKEWTARRFAYWL
ncbi:MAG: cardiolipin synthase [Rhodoferax sp.]